MTTLLRSCLLILVLCVPAIASDADFTSVFTEKAPAKKIAADSFLKYAVRVNVVDPSGKDLKWFASGVIIPEGVLTCAHAVPKKDLAITVEHDGKGFQAKVEKVATDFDLALLSVSWGTVPQAAKLAKTAVSVGDDVVSCGRNKTGELDQQSHKVLSVNRWEKFAQFEVSNAPNQGRSGSGVFNKDGDIVGLVYAMQDIFENGNRRSVGWFVDLSTIKRVLDEPKPSAPQDPPRRRHRRRAYVFTAEAAYGDGWCINCKKLKAQWGDGNEDVELIWSKEIAPGGFNGDDQYPAVRFKDKQGVWHYPGTGNQTYRMPSSLEDLAGVIDRGGQ